MRKGNRWLKGVLVQAAWAASHTKGTYLAAHAVGWRSVGAGSGRWWRWGTRCW
ncbi:MAG: hypothetical protein U0736_01500 [Gemmataceae bacterium]